MLKMKLNRKEPINISSLIAKKAIAVVLLIVLFTCIICSCKAAGKNKPVLNTTETTESSEETYGRMKGVVISGRETETTKTTSEKTEPTETTVMETTVDTSVPTEQTNPVTPTKSPAKKRAVAKKKPVKRRITKKSNKKKSTKKKSTPSQTSTWSWTRAGSCWMPQTPLSRRPRRRATNWISLAGSMTHSPERSIRNRNQPASGLG